MLLFTPLYLFISLDVVVQLSRLLCQYHNYAHTKVGFVALLFGAIAIVGDGKG